MAAARFPRWLVPAALFLVLVVLVWFSARRGIQAPTAALTAGHKEAAFCCTDKDTPGKGKTCDPNAQVTTCPGNDPKKAFVKGTADYCSFVACKRLGYCAKPNAGAKKYDPTTGKEIPPAPATNSDGTPASGDSDSSGDATTPSTPTATTKTRDDLGLPPAPATGMENAQDLADRQQKEYDEGLLTLKGDQLDALRKIHKQERDAFNEAAKAGGAPTSDDPGSYYPPFKGSDNGVIDYAGALNTYTQDREAKATQAVVDAQGRDATMAAMGVLDKVKSDNIMLQTQLQQAVADGAAKLKAQGSKLAGSLLVGQAAPAAPAPAAPAPTCDFVEFNDCEKGFFFEDGAQDKEACDLYAQDPDPRLGLPGYACIAYPDTVKLNDPTYADKSKCGQVVSLFEFHQMMERISVMRPDVLAKMLKDDPTKTNFGIYGHFVPVDGVTTAKDNDAAEAQSVCKDYNPCGAQKVKKGANDSSSTSGGGGQPPGGGGHPPGGGGNPGGGNNAANPAGNNAANPGNNAGNAPATPTSSAKGASASSKNTVVCPAGNSCTASISNYQCQPLGGVCPVGQVPKNASACTVAQTKGRSGLDLYGTCNYPSFCLVSDGTHNSQDVPIGCGLYGGIPTGQSCTWRGLPGSCITCVIEGQKSQTDTTPVTSIVAPNEPAYPYGSDAYKALQQQQTDAANTVAAYSKNQAVCGQYQFCYTPGAARGPDEYTCPQGSQVATIGAGCKLNGYSGGKCADCKGGLGPFGLAAPVPKGGSATTGGVPTTAGAPTAAAAGCPNPYLCVPKGAAAWCGISTTAVAHASATCDGGSCWACNTNNGIKAPLGVTLPNASSAPATTGKVNSDGDQRDPVTGNTPHEISEPISKPFQPGVGGFGQANLLGSVTAATPNTCPPSYSCGDPAQMTCGGGSAHLTVNGTQPCGSCGICIDGSKTYGPAFKDTIPQQTLPSGLQRGPQAPPMVPVLSGNTTPPTHSPAGKQCTMTTFSCNVGEAFDCSACSASDCREDCCRCYKFVPPSQASVSSKPDLAAACTGQCFTCVAQSAGSSSACLNKAGCSSSSSSRSSTSSRSSSTSRSSVRSSSSISSRSSSSISGGGASSVKSGSSSSKCLCPVGSTTCSQCNGGASSSAKSNSSTSRAPFCGDLRVDAGEQCDAGSLCQGPGADQFSFVTTPSQVTDCLASGGTVKPISQDGCDDQCRKEFCGDGVVEQKGADGKRSTADDEACDNGKVCNDDGRDCRADADCVHNVGPCTINQRCSKRTDLVCASDADCLLGGAKCIYNSAKDKNCSAQCQNQCGV